MWLSQGKSKSVRNIPRRCTGAYLGGTLGHVSPLCRRRRLPTPPAAPDEEASFWLLRPKKGQGKIFLESVHKKVSSQKGSTKIALDTGGALSTVRPLGLTPLTIF